MDELRRRALQREKLEQEATAEQEEEEDVPQEEEELLEVDDPLVEIPVGHKKYDKRMNVLRRTNCETALAFMIHLCLLIYCTGVNVYDSTAFKRCKDRDMVFVGHDTFGWRFKYLTFLTMWGLFLYFFLAFFNDIMPQSFAKVKLHRLIDWLFTTVVWPVACIEVILFWTMMTIDPNLLRRSESYELCVPRLLDHALHTFPILVVLLESMLVYHRYPRNIVAAFSIFAMCTGYFVWVLMVFTKIHQWPYAFMYHLNPLAFILFMFGCTVFGGCIYAFGKILASFRWRKRFLILKQLAEEEAISMNDED